MPRIQIIIVNHNTSLFTELALRSLLATHSADLDLAITVMDNASNDDTADLRAFTVASGIPFVQSGFSPHTAVNTHGEVLRAFVLTHPDCDYYLLLDADICFLQPNTLHTMLTELQADDSVFAVQARMSWDGVNEMPGRGWHIEAGKSMYMSAHLAGQPISADELAHSATAYTGQLLPRCHPGCALVKNTPTFRRVAEHIGFSPAWLQGETQPASGFYDTFALCSAVMKTHEQRYILSSAMVLHFFCVSYDPQGMDWKRRVCRERLAQLRS
ncbi:MAG: hypothetical protein U0694_23040 [Anaerolineae bacterium]